MTPRSVSDGQIPSLSRTCRAEASRPAGNPSVTATSERMERYEQAMCSIRTGT